MTIKEKIIGYSKKIGISLIGFTNPQQISKVRERLIQRRDQGGLCGLEEQDIEARVNILRHYPWAKSIIVIGVGYNIAEESSKEGLYGYICKSGYIRDYHRVVEERALGLVDYICRLKDFRYSIHVDKGPLVDREAAYQSGIGWYGKNCCIINPNLGSWFVIGQIITDLDIEKDSPGDDGCKDCRLCIDACPAGALLGDYTMDASRCLSYLTQKRGEMNSQERKLMGNRLYGCDTCQLVCPHNRDKYIEDDLSIPGKSDLGDLFKILGMSNKEFNAVYKQTGAGWRGKKTMQRNALIVLENIGTEKVLEGLKELAKDNSHPLAEDIKGVIERLQSKRI